MIDLSKRVRTKLGIPIRELKEEKKNCNCSLNSSNISGQVFLNGNWHYSKWNSLGTNLSGISNWDIENY